MELDPKRPVIVSITFLLVVALLLLLGWCATFFFLGKITGSEITKIISAFGVDVVQALIIGIAAGFLIHLYLLHALGETAEAKLRRSGIKDIYHSRINAKDDFRHLIENRKIKQINIIGISLRDFLLPGGKLYSEVWEVICKRLSDEHEMSMVPKDRLHVRLLLLAPKSSEGVFRHNVERDTLGEAGFPHEIPIALEEIAMRQRTIYKGNPQEFLQVRFYEHCTFAFMFITESEAFIEQYCYRDHTRGVILPIVKYSKNSLQYGETLYSFNVIWEHAILGKILPSHVGTAEAIEKARIKNIFRREQRPLLGDREIECLAAAKPKDTVRILSITGKFYTSNTQNTRPFETLQKIASPKNPGGSVQVRFAISNPISQQAILRAVADSSPAEGIGEALLNWNWEKHKNSRIFQDVHRTIRDIEEWACKGWSFELRLYCCSISCALLLTSNAAFVEQYLYGRSRRFEEGLVLGGEYPVTEYEMIETESVEEKIEQEILLSHFKVIWDCFSISLNDYKKRNQKEAFQENLAQLKGEFTCHTIERMA
jgi:hypothetical protein